MMTAREEVIKLRREARRLRVENGRLKYLFQKQKQKVNELDQLLKEREKFIKELIKERDYLTALIEELKRQREVYKGMVYKPNKKVKEIFKTDLNPLKKQRGGQKGHQGYGRKLPPKIDKEFYVFANYCPFCQTSLSRTKSTVSHTVEDLPQLEDFKIEIKKYTLERQWCPHCQKEIIAFPKEIIPYSRLGLNLILQVLIWKYLCRLPFSLMLNLLRINYHLSLSRGTLVKILKRTKSWLRNDYQEILKQIRASPVKHADETTWRINGINSWLWAFITRKEVYYTMEETRGKGVPERILSASLPTDVLIRDDYPAYHKLPLKQQSCWAHLLRKSHEAVSQPNASLEVKELHEKLKLVFSELSEIISYPFEEKFRQESYHYFSQIIKTIQKKSYQFTDAQKIQERIKNQGNNLLTALLYENVPLTNNLAERLIRPMVVTRKISGGSRSDEGAETHAVNMSILQTIKMRNQPVVSTLREYLLKGIFGEK